MSGTIRFIAKPLRAESARASLSFDNLPFADALDRILKTCKAPVEMTFEGGTYKFHPK